MSRSPTSDARFCVLHEADQGLAALLGLSKNLVTGVQLLRPFIGPLWIGDIAVRNRALPIPRNNIFDVLCHGPAPQGSERQNGDAARNFCARARKLCRGSRSRIPYPTI